MATLRPRPLPRLATGIRGFDLMLQGGLPRGRTVLVAGGAGTGKTVLVNEFLYRGVVQSGEPGVLVTFEERPEDLVRNVGSFGWDYPRLIAARKLAIVDASPEPGAESDIGGDYDLEPLLIRVRQAVRRIRARRLVLDSIDALTGRIGNRAAVRDLLFRLAQEARRLGVTSMITAEMPQAGGTRHDVEAFVADGVIELTFEPGQQQTVRHIVVRKLRGTGYRSGRVEFGITDHGLEVFPKLPVDRHLATTSLDPARRKRFGIEGFDEEVLGGGLPEGYMVLVSGNTGTGKSTFARHFIAEGVRCGEPAVLVALEEPSGQVVQLAAGHGWRFGAWERRGSLAMIDVPLIDIRADDVLHRIVRAVEAVGARRVVIDSISSLRSATLTSEQVRQFMVQLGDYVKSKGLTCVMTYLVAELFGAGKGQLLAAMSTSDARLSSACDGVILQRFVEREQQVRRLVTVLKLRGAGHSRGIFSYDIGAKGVEMGERFEA